MGAEQFPGPRRQVSKKIAKSPTDNPVNKPNIDNIGYKILLQGHVYLKVILY